MSTALKSYRDFQQILTSEVNASCLLGRLGCPTPPLSSIPWGFTSQPLRREPCFLAHSIRALHELFSEEHDIWVNFPVLPSLFQQPVLPLQVYVVLCKLYAGVAWAPRKSPKAPRHIGYCTGIKSKISHWRKLRWTYTLTSFSNAKSSSQSEFLIRDAMMDPRKE